MITSSSPDLPQKSLQIKQDDKFFSRLLSKESSMANPSFRVYYGVASGAVPFMWESQPGTPKHKFFDTSLPPLTPPPSYQFSSKKKPIKNPSKSKFLHIILTKFSLRKNHVSTLSPSSSLSSSSWSSSMSTPTTPLNFHRRSRFSSPRSSFDSRGGDGDQAFAASRFGVAHETNAGGSRGCNSMVIMKNALLSIVGHGSRQGTA